MNMSIHSVKDVQVNASFRAPGNDKTLFGTPKEMSQTLYRISKCDLEINYETLETLCSLQRHKGKQSSKFKRVGFVKGILMPGVPHAMAPEEGLVCISPLFSA